VADARVDVQQIGHTQNIRVKKFRVKTFSTENISAGM
jgi:hypothetical protein